MIDIGHDVNDFIGAVRSFKYACRCPLFPAGLLEFACSKRSRYYCAYSFSSSADETDDKLALEDRTKFRAKFKACLFAVPYICT